MDLLFSKYANPFLFVDGMIQTGRFAEFVLEFIELENEKQLWEFYLHKVYDKSFEDFKRSLRPVRKPTQTDIKTTVNDSKSILDGFIPNGTGVNANGTI